MSTLLAFLAIIGFFPYTPAKSASINYEPIKITVNENFNVLPDRAAQGPVSVNPSFVQQGANFYFHPKLMLPPGYIPSQIEALISSLQHKTEFISKHTPLDIFVEKDKVTEVLKSSPEIPSTPEKDVLMEDIEITEVSMPTPTEIILMEELDRQPPLPPIIVDEEPKPINQEIEAIPEAPLLPALSFHGIPSDVAEEIKIEEPILLEDSMEIFPPIPEISTGTIREPIRVPEITIVDDDLEVPSRPPPAIIDEELKPVNQVLEAIPDSPVLPPLSFHIIPPIVEEEMIKEEPILLEESTQVLPSAPEIYTGLTQEPNNDPKITIIDEKFESLAPPPIIIDGGPNLVNGELDHIAEIPVLEPSTNDYPPDVEDEVKIKNPILFDDSIDVFPPIPEISISLIESPKMPEITISDKNIEVRPPPPPIIIDEVPKQMNEELFVIQEVPVLPSLPFEVNPPDVVKEVEIKKPILSGESLEVFPSIPEISVGTILEPKCTIEREKLERLAPPPPVIIEGEPKHVTQELEVIPEAPVLPPLSFHIDPDIVLEKVKNEEPILLEKSMEEFLPNPEISTDRELLVIPEAPVLPPLSYQDNPPNVVEVEIEEPTILDESMDVLPQIPEISVGPILEPIRIPEITIVQEKLVGPPSSPLALIDDEPKPLNQKFESISSDFMEKVKIEKQILLEDSMKISTPISEISAVENLQPIVPIEISKSFELEEISRPNPCTECVISIKKKVSPITTNTKAQGAFAYLPMMKRKDFLIPKLKENVFLPRISKQPFRFPQNLVSQLLSKLFMTPILEKRIVPNTILKRKSPNLKRDALLSFPKGPSKI